jgi:16S rRNA (guanine527-N7)-methyltransferase
VSGPFPYSALDDVSRETKGRLDQLVALVKKWNPAINLVSRATLTDLWERHIVDSAQLFPLRPEGCCRWADLGSGGGFPGLVIAILAAEQEPQMIVTLVESDQRKATFLREASRILGISPIIKCERIEATPPIDADVISARALAPVSDLCEMAYRHLKPGGTAMFLKGRGYAADLEAARAKWTFTADTIPSRTDAEAAVLCLKSIERV